MVETQASVGVWGEPLGSCSWCPDDTSGDVVVGFINHSDRDIEMRILVASTDIAKFTVPAGERALALGDNCIPVICIDHHNLYLASSHPLPVDDITVVQATLNDLPRHAIVDPKFVWEAAGTKFTTSTVWTTPRPITHVLPTNPIPAHGSKSGQSASTTETMAAIS